MDGCGNELTGQTYSHTGSDQTAPTLSGTPYAGTTGTNACKANAATAAPFSATDAIQGYSDNCGGAVTAHLTNTSVTGTDATWAVTYTFKVKDACGNELTNQSYSNTGGDKTAPSPISLTVTPTCLWPPNHKMRDVTLNYTSTDNCGGITTCAITVTSNEPENGLGDGDTGPDWEILDDHHIRLRAERSGTGDGRIYTISVTCTDAAGNSTTSNTAAVIVAHNITGPSSGYAVKVGTTINMTGTFWDIPGNKHTAKWLIDGSSANGTVTAEPVGLKSGTAKGSYKLTLPGVYKLQMNITDQKGITSYANTNGDLEAIVVAYDPNGGYTYGGGSFNSPAGAVPSNPTLTGKVSFGFQSNYYKNATNPKGETQFDLKIGDMEFNALNFDYLAVNGAFAQFKGSGKLITNGGLIVQSGIYFMMTVIDGQLNGGGVDKIRMKIYNKNTNQVYYDNQPGASDADAPTTAVNNDGSQIVIVNTSSTTTNAVTQARNAQTDVAAEVKPELPAALSFELKAFPNPTENYFTVKVTSPVNATVEVRMVDVLGKVIQVERGAPGQSLRFGDNAAAGMYILEARQPGQREKAILKVIKLN